MSRTFTTRQQFVPNEIPKILFNLEKLKIGLRDAGLAAVKNSQAATARVAVQRAPIRRIFAGERRRYKRPLTQEEAQEYETQTGGSATGVEVYKYRRQSGKDMRREDRLRRVFAETKLGDLAPAQESRHVGGTHYVRNPGDKALTYKIAKRGDDLLSADGRAELRLGRAITRNSRLGGRLRRSIQSEPLVREGKMAVGYIRAYAPYARYVEFGTRHAPAQPFMRPALTFARRNFPSEVKRTIGRLGVGSKR